MKKLLLLGLAVLLFYATTASAVILQPGSAVTQGHWVISAQFLSESEANDTGFGTLDLFGYSPTVTYGIFDRLSASLGYVGGNTSGDLTIPIGPGVAISGDLNGSSSGYTALLNYTFFDEMLDQTPVSVKLAGAYTGVHTTFDPDSAFDPIGGSALFPDADSSTWDARLTVSKLIIPFVPYVGFKYGSYNTTVAGSSSEGTLTEFLVGTGLFISRNIGFFAEYVAKNTVPESGDSRSTNQIGGSVVFLL